MRSKFSIRYKFLAVTTLLLVFCVGIYLLLATKVFKSDKTEFVFDYNRSTVTNIASEINTLFSGLSDKMKLVAYTYFQKSLKKDSSFIRDLFSNNNDIVYVGTSHKFKKINDSYYLDKNFIETYAIPKDYFNNKVLIDRPIPFQRIQIHGEAIWNATIKDGPPLIGYGKSVVEEDRNGVPFNQFAVVAYLKADRVLKSLNQTKLNEVYIVNSSGEVLAHPNPQLLYQKNPLKNEKIYQDAKAHKLKTSVVQYEIDGNQVLGAFSKTYNNKIFVISKVSGQKAFAAVNRLIYRSLIFASIVVTIAFIVAILFSRTLTHPLRVLMGGMKKVSEGDLGSHISIKTNDEISSLANSFNSMIDDLRDSRRELEVINRDLEKKVKERTHQLEKQNLAVKEAQEKLLRTTRLAAVGEIAGQAAHEVLNPLTSIMSRVQKVKERLSEARIQEVELLEQIKNSWSKDFAEGGFKKLVGAWEEPSSIDPKNSLWDEDLDNIGKISHQMVGEYRRLLKDTDFLIAEGQRINRIVNSMRSMSTVKTDFKEHSVHDLLAKSVNIMADLATQYNTGFDIQLLATDDIVYMNEDEFIQALTNLLRNSLQAIGSVKSDDGDVGSIRVVTGNSEGIINIMIEDNGEGIDDENKSKLFKKSFTTKSISEGTGLGMKISRRFIRAFEGDIYLKSSAVGEGSVFVVTLPLTSAKSKEAS